MGMCRHAPIAGCCTDESDCADRDPCTQKECQSNVCVFVSVLGCVPNRDAGGEVLDGERRADAGGPDARGARDSAATSAGPDGGQDPGSVRRDAGTTGPREGGSGQAPEGDGSLRAPEEPGERRAGARDIRGGACAVAAGSRPGGRGAGQALALLLIALATRRRRRACLAATLLAGMLWTTHVQAQGRFRLDRPHTTALPEDLVWLERAGSEIAQDGPFGRLVLAFADDPLVATGPEGQEQALVSERRGLQGAAGFTVFRQLHLAVGAPGWVQRGDGVALDADGDAFVPTSPALGDPSVDARWDMWRQDGVGVGLAVAATLPLGAATALAGDKGPGLLPRVSFAWSPGSGGSFIGANAGLWLRPQARMGELRVGPAARWTIGGQLALSGNLAATLELTASTVLSRAFDARHTPVEAGVGMRHVHPAGLSFGLGLGAGLSGGFGAPDARAFATLGYRFRQRSRPSGAN